MNKSINSSYCYDDELFYFDNPIFRIYSYETVTDHQTKLLKYWFNFESNFKRISGVYFIKDFYIGRSSSIRKRLNYHMRSARRKDKWFSGTSKHLAQHIKEHFKADLQMPVTILSNNPDDEGYYIRKYLKLGYPLLNIMIPKEDNR